jgi:hypothetical protein
MDSEQLQEFIANTVQQGMKALSYQVDYLITKSRSSNRHLLVTKLYHNLTTNPVISLGIQDVRVPDTRCYLAGNGYRAESLRQTPRFMSDE